MFSSVKTVLGAASLIVSLLAISSPAQAVDLTVLFRGYGTESGKSLVDHSGNSCSICMYPDVIPKDRIYDWKGEQLCKSNEGWGSTTALPWPVKQVTISSMGCKTNYSAFLVQGNSETTGAVFKLWDYAELPSNWERFSMVGFVKIERKLQARAQSTETDLPFRSFDMTKQFDPKVQLKYKAKSFLAYPNSNPAATRGMPLPTSGVVVAYTASDLPGGCMQTVLGGSNFVVPASETSNCHGAAQVIAPTTVCSVKTNGGNSALGVTAISGAKTPALPVIQVSGQPTQINMATHFGKVGAKGAAAWFYNEGNSPVQVECKS
jgi:hypothetical protein